MFKNDTKHTIQPKLTIGQPNDQYEQEADAMADQVMRMPQAPLPVQRKCEDCEEESLQMKPLSESITPLIQRNHEEEEELQMKGFDSGVIQMKSNEVNSDLSSQLSQTKGDGNKLPESTNQFMSTAFGADFSSVNIHTNSSAIQMNRSLNARAFTHGNDIYFNKGEYNPSEGEGKRLLAHELTHVVQQGQNKVSPRIQRKDTPEVGDDFDKLSESIYVIAKEDFYFYTTPEFVTPSTVLVTQGQRLELTSKSIDTYFAYSETGTKGYVRQQHLTFPPKVKRPAREEFTSVIGDILFIQAKNMHRAFVLAKKVGLTPNVGMIFWYSNGLKKPYPVKYEITIRDPNEEDIERMNKVADFSSLPGLTGSAIAKPGYGMVPDEYKLNKKQRRYRVAVEELAPYIQKFLTKSSEAIPNRMVYNVPVEWIKSFNFTFEEFRLAKGFPFSQDRDSDYSYYMGVYTLEIKARIKEVLTGIIYKPKDPRDDTGSLEFWIENKENMVESNREYLDAELEKIVKEEQENRKSDIEVFFKPYKEKLENEQNEFIKKAKAKIDKMEGWYNREVATKAAMEVIKKRQDEVLEVAREAFLASAIQKEIVKAVETRYEAIVKTITEPDPYTHATLKKDTDFISILRGLDAKLKAAPDYKAKDRIFRQALVDVEVYLKPRYPNDEWVALMRVVVGHFLDDLLVAADGKISVYAIKEWAERNVKDIKEAMDRFTPLWNKRMNQEFENTRLISVSMKSVGFVAYTDLFYELGYAQLFFQEVVDHPENDEGFWDGFTSKSLGEFIPFVHSVISISRMYEQHRVASKAAEGGTLTLSEELLLKAIAALHQVNAMKEKPFWYSVGEGVAEAIPFIGEFILTLPLGLGVGSITVKTMEAGVKKIGKEYLERQLVKYIIKGVGFLAGSLAQTVANPLDIQNNILKHKMHVVNLKQNEDGSFTVEVDANKESEASAAWKGFMTSYINVFTERLGGKILPFAASKVAGAFTKFIPMVARQSVVGMQLKEAAKFLKKYAGFHGILGEYEEEVYNQILEAMLTGKQLKWDWKDQLKTFTIVGIVGAGMHGVQAMIAGYEIMRTFRYKERKVVLPVEVYTMLTRLNSEQKMREFMEAIKKMKLTTKQKEVAVFLAQHTLNIENEIRLTTVEKAEMQQGVNRPKTMSDLVKLTIQLYGARKNFIIAKQNNETGHVESVLLQGDSVDVNIPLLLNDITEVDAWIAETETAIAILDGLSVSEIKESVGVTNGIEENIQMWKNWMAGWRPYIDVVKTLSPDSKITLTPENKVNINDNILISTRILYRLTVTNLPSLERLLIASKSAVTAKSISPEATKAVKRLDPDSKVEKEDSGAFVFNREIQVSKKVMGALIPNAKAAGGAKFLLEESKRARVTFDTINEFKPEDINAVRNLHTDSAIVELNADSLSINNQVVLSKSFVKDLLINNQTDLTRLLIGTYQLEAKGGNITLLDEANWKVLLSFSKSSSYRLRFRFQYETEVNVLINALGIQANPKFTALWNSADHSAKVRFWDLYNEIGGYSKDRTRRADSTPELRQLAMDFALKMSPKNIGELVDYYQYFIADFKTRKNQLLTQYNIDANILQDDITQKIKLYADSQGRKKPNKADRKLFADLRKSETKKLWDKYFGKSTSTSESLADKAYSHMVIEDSDSTVGVGTIDPTRLAEITKEFKEGATAMEGQMAGRKIDPALENIAAINAVRQIQDIPFGSMTAAVYHVKKHHHELPQSLQDSLQPTDAYIQAARKTIKEAPIVSIYTDPIAPGTRSISFVLPYQETSGEKFNLTAIVRVNGDGTVSLATLMIKK